MHTFQISVKALDAYRNEKLTEERINFLINQANKQLDEISQNKELYNRFLNQVNAPKKIDNIILWMLFMSNEAICDEYIEAFDKDFREIIPVSDLADLLAYVVHLKKVKNKFFTRQFKGAKLESPPRYDLSRRVNNISGATLSVNALRKLSRFALYLDQRVSS